jgi:signal transduction histidine kinase/DNA-binding response OmpR family regulator/streptogramin lyase
MSFHQLTNQGVIAVLEDPRESGVLWLNERGAVSRFDVATGQREVVVQSEAVNMPDPAPRFFAYDAMPRSMIWDRRNPSVLWVAANTAGLFRIDTATGDVEHYVSYHEVGHRGSYLSGYPSCIFQDRSGILWFGTYGAGITYADPASGQHYRVSTSRWIQPQYKKPSGEVTAVMEDRLGRWWVGTKDSKRHLLMIDRATGKERRWFGVPSTIDGRLTPFGDIYALLEDRHGDIWIGEVHVEYSDSSASTGWRVWDKGVLYRLDITEERFESFRHEPDDPGSLPWGGILSLFEDEDGIIWAGTVQGGIARIDPETGNITSVHVDNHSNSAFGFLEDSAGRVWVGTHDGICLLDRASSSCRVFDLPVKRDPNAVELVERPSEPGNLWVGSWSGLFQFDTRTETFSRAAETGPVTTMHIVDLVADRFSNLWLATDGDGVFRFEPETGALTLPDLRLKHHGLGAGMLTSEGEVVFGSSGFGLRVFDSRDTVSHSTPPQVLITRVVSSQRGRLQVPLTGNLPRVNLQNVDESFSIEYVALDYSDPSRNEYAYMLEGLQDEWQYVGSSRRATFSGLDPGEYTFRVKGASSFGIWNETGASLGINVPPPWWLTGWAYAMYALLIVGSLIVAERVRHVAIVRRERHRAELQEREIRSEVAEEKATQAAEHARRLEELSEAKSRFFANVSHEFRTPLTLILGVADDVESGRFGRPTEALRKAVHLIVRNARRVDELVRELLDLSRLESGRMKLSLRQEDLGQTILELVRSHTPLAERNTIDLIYQGPEKPVPASFDKDRISIAVGNLISNAIKFTEERGTVNVSLRTYEGREGDTARIEVRDSGVGIAETDLPRVFERFHQVDTTSTRRREGIGIGLAMVSEIVELHGGSVEVQSELGVGSTFTIHLPLVGASEVDAEPSEDAGESPASHIELGEDVSTRPEEYELGGNGASAVDLGEERERVKPPGDKTAPIALIVEDNHDVRAFIRDHFEQDFRVLEAPDGREGLRMTRRYPPDLVISDIMMPEMDGIQMCQAIKEDPALRNVPVILVTARAGEEEALEGLRAGADEYITKPFSVALLLQLAKNVVANRVKAPSDSSGRIFVGTPEEELESQDDALLRRVVDVVGSHIGDAFFTVDMLADEIGLSRRQLERRLPDACGESPSELIRRIRLERARQLLENDVGTVSEITYSTGYRSPSRFASAFRRAYGMTPSEYRQANNTD